MTPSRQHGDERLSLSDFVAPSLIERSRTFGASGYLSVIVGLSVLTYLLGFAALFLTPPGSGAALWWPAAGSSVLLVMVYRGHRWHMLALVGLIGFASNVSVGRTLALSAAVMVVLVAEVWAVSQVVKSGGRRAHLANMRGLGHFLLAVSAGAVTIGVGGAAALYLFAGFDPVVTFGALLLSHGSALLVIVPVALVPISQRPLDATPLRVIEGVVQFTATLLVTAIVFSPDLPTPLLFTLFPFLAWAASRFRPLYVVVQLISLTVLVPTLTVVSGGPTGEAQGIPGAGFYVQLFLVSSAITTLFLSATRSEREALVEDRERRAELLRGGFIGAQVGFLILQHQPDGELEIIESNAVASTMIQGGWLAPALEAWLTTDERDLNRELTLPDTRSYHVFASRTSEALGTEAIGVQLVEITESILDREALARSAEREHAAAEELRELSRQKDDFVSAVSHELRTPITSILGFAEELEEVAAPDARQAADVIVRNSRRLAAMVEQLLELGRVTATEKSSSAGAANLDQTVAHTTEEQQLSAAARGVAIELDLHAPGALVALEGTTLERIVTNLLSNAIKFTPDQGRVRLSTSLAEGTAHLHVDDSGVGISPSDRGRVFDRFFRSADDAKLATPGTGLGLSIVRSLIHESGGQITIEDSPLGGTRMTVLLPLVSATPHGTPLDSVAGEA